MKEKQILAVVKEPGQSPRVEPLFDNTLEAFQQAVGGYIETVTIASDPDYHLQRRRPPVGSSV